MLTQQREDSLSLKIERVYPLLRVFLLKSSARVSGAITAQEVFKLFQYQIPLFPLRLIYPTSSWRWESTVEYLQQKKIPSCRLEKYDQYDTLFSQYYIIPRQTNLQDCLCKGMNWTGMIWKEISS